MSALAPIYVATPRNDHSTVLPYLPRRRVAEAGADEAADKPISRPLVVTGSIAVSLLLWAAIIGSATWIAHLLY
jgi:hypothetical protein